MTPATLDPAALQQRYALLCRALQATQVSDDSPPVLDTVNRLDNLIHRELLELARLGSPDDFADIYLGFTQELVRFREFCADPRLAEKTVVAFGGPFSAGKSSLINALIGKKLLVVEVDPTTALPAYVLSGEEDAVHALNLHHLRVPLSDDELSSLTHDEVHRYGSQVARAFSAAFVTRRDFPWANLAFIDTPGYTGSASAGDRTDADIAAAQLGGANAIVWVASIKQGNLSEEDLAFLARLDPAIPRLVVASHADQLTESDRNAVIERMRETLAARNLPVLGVHAVSSRPRQAELLTPLRAQLDQWNQTSRQQRFTHRFKTLFTRYQRGLEREASAARWQQHRINRIATLSEGDIVVDAGELKTVVSERLDALKTVETRLHELRTRFFGELKRAGDIVGIPLPEPIIETETAKIFTTSNIYNPIDTSILLGNVDILSVDTNIVDGARKVYIVDAEDRLSNRYINVLGTPKLIPKINSKLRQDGLYVTKIIKTNSGVNTFKGKTEVSVPIGEIDNVKDIYKSIEEASMGANKTQLHSDELITKKTELEHTRLDSEVDNAKAAADKAKAMYEQWMLSAKSHYEERSYRNKSHYKEYKYHRDSSLLDRDS